MAIVLLTIGKYFNYSSCISLYLFQRIEPIILNSNYYDNQHREKVI